MYSLTLKLSGARSWCQSHHLLIIKGMVQIPLDMVKAKTVPQHTSSMALHRMMADWGEGASVPFGGEGGGAAPGVGDVTWIHTFFATATWTTPGGDYAATPSGATPVSQVNQLYKWNSTSTMVADVQGWLDTPAQNFGWVLIGAEAPTDSITAKGFATRQTQSATAPKLIIHYTK
jgi:hypothetical protein